MTNFDLIAEAIEMINAGDNTKAAARLKQFVTLNTPKVKGGKVKIYDWTNPKGCYAFTRGVYYDAENSVAVATDTHVMLVSKSDYDASRANAIVAKNGDEVEGVRYPDYLRVIPKAENMREFQFDNARIANLLTKMNAERKIDKSIKYIAFNVGDKDSQVYISPKNCKLLLTLPAGKFYTRDPRSQLLYKSDDENYTAVVMPVCVKDEFIGIEKVTQEQAGWS